MKQVGKILLYNKQLQLAVIVDANGRKYVTELAETLPAFLAAYQAVSFNVAIKSGARYATNVVLL